MADKTREQLNLLAARDVVEFSETSAVDPKPFRFYRTLLRIQKEICILDAKGDSSGFKPCVKEIVVRDPETLCIEQWGHCQERTTLLTSFRSTSAIKFHLKRAMVARLPVTNTRSLAKSSSTYFRFGTLLRGGASFHLCMWQLL
ncbi:hypothetical protein AVEN_8930-1 [Araneus ventricosus]|uniref:Uncharacterized protein n=1 Tax=Araneus ventricosus TaxID=182803 RepID=A0A4Y2DFU4_ARAVE|nr:hypothetical protein AVEN_8930-1 [Araneus ventricosus]